MVNEKALYLLCLTAMLAAGWDLCLPQCHRITVGCQWLWQNRISKPLS
jgi:hypothetical protein